MMFFPGCCCHDQAGCIDNCDASDLAASLTVDWAVVLPSSDFGLIMDGSSTPVTKSGVSWSGSGPTADTLGTITITSITPDGDGGDVCDGMWTVIGSLTHPDHTGDFSGFAWIICYPGLGIGMFVGSTGGGFASGGAS